MYNLYNTIIMLCKKQGINVTEMCRRTGVNRGSLGDLARGRKQRLSPDNLSKIAEYFGVTIEYLLGKEPAYPSNIRPVALKKLPMLGEIACGEPKYAEQEYGIYVDVADDTKADFCLTCKGDSMIGAGIFDGDVVMIQTMPLVPNGKIAAVQIGDEATLKKWEYYPDKNRVVLTPYNSAYQTLIFDGEEINEIRCLGLAVSVTKKLK